jgi:hypothetical protein
VRASADLDKNIVNPVNVNVSNTTPLHIVDCAISYSLRPTEGRRVHKASGEMSAAVALQVGQSTVGASSTPLRCHQL